MKIKEVVISGRNQVELQEEELDKLDLRAREVFIQTECTFISAGTELANFTGREPKVFQSGSWCAYHWKSGYANVGIVRETGPYAIQAKVGVLLDWNKN